MSKRTSFTHFSRCVPFCDRSVLVSFGVFITLWPFGVDLRARTKTNPHTVSCLCAVLLLPQNFMFVCTSLKIAILYSGNTNSRSLGITTSAVKVPHLYIVSCKARRPLNPRSSEIMRCDWLWFGLTFLFAIWRVLQGSKGRADLWFPFSLVVSRYV